MAKEGRLCCEFLVVALLGEFDLSFLSHYVLDSVGGEEFQDSLLGEFDKLGDLVGYLLFD